MIELADDLTVQFIQVTEGKSVEQKWQNCASFRHRGPRYRERDCGVGQERRQEDHGKWMYLDTESILGFKIELIRLPQSV